MGNNPLAALFGAFLGAHAPPHHHYTAPQQPHGPVAHTAEETVTIKTGSPMVAIVNDRLVPVDFPSGDSFEVDNIGVHPSTSSSTSE